MLALGQQIAAMTGAPLLDHSHKGQTLLDKLMGREGDVQLPDPEPTVPPARMSDAAARPAAGSGTERTDNYSDTPLDTVAGLPNSNYWKFVLILVAIPIFVALLMAFSAFLKSP